MRRGLWVVVELVVWGAACSAAGANAASIAVTTTAEDPGANSALCSLREAIIAANSGIAVGGCAAGDFGVGNTIVLQAGASYVLTMPDTPASTGPAARGWWYGPDALPAIASEIVVEGHGATIEVQASTSLPAFFRCCRIFFVAADPASPATPGFTSPGAGNLTLHELTLRGGLAHGGDGVNGGGGGAGMGGAIFNQGQLTLEAVTLNANTAQGGDGGQGLGGPGGGIGTDGNNQTGEGGGFGYGGFGGASGGSGGPHGSGGGGAGFVVAEVGGAGSLASGGSGGGQSNGMGASGSAQSDGAGSGPGGDGGDGSGGGGGSQNLNDASDGGGGGGFGFGGRAGGCELSSGGGGVGGGGGGVGSSDPACPAGVGGGGFGGGGGSGFSGVGGGGFGGGGGAGCTYPCSSGTLPGGAGGFGGGDGNAHLGAGGGAGLGGAVFNDQGTVTIINSTLSGNAALGGNGAASPADVGGGSGGAGSGLGGAIFNLNGQVTVQNSTLANNSAANTGGGIYTLAYDAAHTPAATVSLRDSILSGSPAGASDLVLDKPARVAGGGPNPGSSTGDALAPNIVRTEAVLGGGAITGSPLTGDPLLGPLTFNGGPGMATMAPSSASPALRAGSGCPPVDERGTARLGGLCDLGAYQLSAPPMTPVLTTLRVSPSKISIAGRRVRGRCVKPARRNYHDKHCRRPLALTISYVLSLAGNVSFTLNQSRPGRKVSGRCVKPTAENRKHKRCQWLTGVPGTITRSSAAGANSFTFDGRIGGHELGPGTYQLTARPDGGEPQTSTVRIVG